MEICRGSLPCFWLQLKDQPSKNIIKQPTHTQAAIAGGWSHMQPTLTCIVPQCRPACCSRPRKHSYYMQIIENPGVVPQAISWPKQLWVQADVQTTKSRGQRSWQPMLVRVPHCHKRHPPRGSSPKYTQVEACSSVRCMHSHAVLH